MRVSLTANGCTLTREPGDKALSHESNTAFHMRRLLNDGAGMDFKRFNPSRYGLTSCKVGIRSQRLGIVLWHDRYAIEEAHKEFNAGSVFFSRIDTEGL